MTERWGRTCNPANGTVAIDIGGTATSLFGRMTISGAATLDGMLNLALVNGFSPALGNSFQVMTFDSRTGQFATINGLALGNGKQFTPAYTATNLTLDVTTAAPIPALPDSDGRGGGVRDKRRQVNGRAASPTRRNSSPAPTRTTPPASCASPSSTSPPPGCRCSSRRNPARPIASNTPTI